ncbi:MAG: formate--tetrahydrofolate ligase [Actinomycetaceae bacterium]|nr:formate--tetrahydrofolate ligase [Actinomycetaceae bacterium]
MPNDLEIVQSAILRPMEEIGASIGCVAEDIELYGRDIAKLDLKRANAPQKGKYVVVTAVTPTPLGEGKTTTVIGLVQGMGKLGKHAVAALRQPSLGPVFGIKGGAAGAGYSQVVPMESMNLHLSGDFHAITAAHNLLAAMVDNHLQHGNALRIDPSSITWGRVMDMNDRSLRSIVVGLGGRLDGVPRQSRFDITAASEVMTLVSLSRDLWDLRARLGRIVIGFNAEGEAVTAEDLKAAGAMCVLLKDALRPNLLQTLEGQAAIVHCGPFGNIATGNNSIVADRVALAGADMVVTEAGFGADLGFERFVNVKCRVSGLVPDVAVVVATVRALKVHSGNYVVRAGMPLPPELLESSVDDVSAGLVNLGHHLDIVAGAGVRAVVAINAFPEDHEEEHQVIRDFCASRGVACAVTRHVAQGGAGAVELAEMVWDVAHEGPAALRFTYELEQSLESKIESVAREVYGANGVDFDPKATRELQRFEELGYGELPVLIAKTHLSTTATASDRGAPSDWVLPVREVRLAAGAGYVYALTGTIQTMPGLGTHPAAENIDIDEAGNIVGLF